METGEVYCQRCFRLRHYNDIQDVQLTDDDFLRLLNGLGTEDALIVNVVDILTLMALLFQDYIVLSEIILCY